MSTPHTEESAPKSEADEATVNRIALVSQGDSRADDKADDGALFAADVVKAADRTGFEDGGHGPGSAKPDADGRGPAGWDVKGNANSGLFHTPESPWYKRTKAEVWFRDAASAAAAGFTDALDRGKDKS